MLIKVGTIQGYHITTPHATQHSNGLSGLPLLYIRRDIGTLNNENFPASRISGAYLMGICLTPTYLISVQLMGVYLIGMRLRDIRFIGIHLLGMHFMGVYVMSI
jgi:hypothetical protein